MLTFFLIYFFPPDLIPPTAFALEKVLANNKVALFYEPMVQQLIFGGYSANQLLDYRFHLARRRVVHAVQQSPICHASSPKVSILLIIIHRGF